MKKKSNVGNFDNFNFTIKMANRLYFLKKIGQKCQKLDQFSLKIRFWSIRPRINVVNCFFPMFQFWFFVLIREICNLTPINNWNIKMTPKEICMQSNYAVLKIGKNWANKCIFRGGYFYDSKKCIIIDLFLSNQLKAMDQIVQLTKSIKSVSPKIFP